MSTQQTIVRRLSSSETTFAVVTWSGVIGPDNLFAAFKKAVAAWAETPEGRDEIDDNGGDFNIGDLANACYSSHPLASLLFDCDVFELDIGVFSEDGVNNHTFDTNLA